MLRGDHGEFWLEPVAVSLEEKRGTSSADEMTTDDLGAGARSSVCKGPTVPGGRPHLVFRRSAEQQQQQIEIGAGGRSRRRRKKKRKQERNCGTRGENRHLLLVPISTFARASYNRTLPRTHRRPTPLALSCNMYRMYLCVCTYNVIGRTVVRNVGVSSTPCLSFIFRRR